MYWQISVMIMSFGDQGGGERNGYKTCVLYFMTHNDLCTCITLTKWDGPVTCVNVTENVENFLNKFYHFTATQLWQYQWSNMNMTELPVAFFCWFQRQKDDIEIIAQHLHNLFTTAAEGPSQRGDWNASAVWNREFSNTNLEIFFARCMSYQTGTNEMTHESAQS